YESDPRVPLILGRPFLRTARALIDVQGEEMILRNGDEREIEFLLYQVKIITPVAQEKKLVVSYASWLFEDFDPPFYELLVFKEVPNSIRLLPFSSENEEKVFKLRIYTSKNFHCCFLLELSHPVDDNLREKLLNVHLLIANIEALKDNPTQSFELLTKSSPTSLNSFLEETNTFHNSLPEFENFYFDLGEISSGSTTTHSDISLSEYDSFIFEEFVDELAHIISPPEYDRFYFKDLPDPGELMSVLNSGIRENLSTTLVNLPIEDDQSPLLAYVVWIFVTYLTY
nr:hypothetical protein [Tanacetum cinerariifolium]